MQFVVCQPLPEVEQWMMESSKFDILLKCISMEKLQASAVSLKIVFRAREPVS